MEDIIIDLSKNDISDINVKTKYCVTQEIHDANVKSSIERNLQSLDICPSKKMEEPIAVVCSGPSLKDSYRELSSFSKILTCSGAHDFLIKKGIIPNWHMEADPRKHKVEFVKTPHKDIQYLIASSCHPDMFDCLKNNDIRIWHVLGPENQRDLPNTYPRGHWVLTGGSNVGLRALVMARVLGYTDIHVFGMDCSSEEKFHVNYHPNEPKKKSIIKAKVGDEIFTTTQVFLEYARQFFKETLMLADANVTLHGNGLLQSLVLYKMNNEEQTNKRIKEIKERTNGADFVTIAVVSEPTISKEYLELNKKLHKNDITYGISGQRHAETVINLKKCIHAESVLDYGCGKGTLGRKLPFPIWEYDPAIEGKTDPPRPADLVICTDVLEHIEPEFLDQVLTDLARCTIKLGYFVIYTSQSSKCLEDGRNAHLIQEGEEWWRKKLSEYFLLEEKSITNNPPYLHIVVVPKFIETNII